MTIIIGKQEAGGITIYADKKVTIGDSIMEANKIFKLSNGEYFTGSGILNMISWIKEHIEYKIDQQSIKESIMDVFRNQILCTSLVEYEKDKAYLQLMFTEKGKLYVMPTFSYFQQVEIDHIYCIGSGANVANVALEFTNNIDEVMRICEKHVSNCGLGYETITTGIL